MFDPCIIITLCFLFADSSTSFWEELWSKHIVTIILNDIHDDHVTFWRFIWYFCQIFSHIYFGCNTLVFDFIHCKVSRIDRFKSKYMTIINIWRISLILNISWYFLLWIYIIFNIFQTRDREALRIICKR